jgi:hypothetical protein
MSATIPNTTTAAATVHQVNGVHEHQANGVSSHDPATEYRYAEHYMGKGRPLRIIMVGAGITGVAAVKLYNETFPAKEVEFVIYEKNADVTGTWLENRYPGYVYIPL